jgi:hypothetical protein
MILGTNDTQYNDNHHYDIKHNDNQHNNIPNNDTRQNDTQHFTPSIQYRYAECCLFILLC